MWLYSSRTEHTVSGESIYLSLKYPCVFQTRLKKGSSSLRRLEQNWKPNGEEKQSFESGCWAIVIESLSSKYQILSLIPASKTNKTKYLSVVSKKNSIWDDGNFLFKYSLPSNTIVTWLLKTWIIKSSAEEMNFIWFSGNLKFKVYLCR